WNIQALMDSQDSNRPEHRTALVAQKLSRYNVNIAAISKTRLPAENGMGYTFFWKGKSAEECRTWHRRMKIHIHRLTELPISINEHLITLRVPLTNFCYAVFISMYAPTLDAEDSEKEAFHASLDRVLTAVKTDDCWMDHRLIRSKFSIQVAPKHHRQRALRKKTNVQCLKNKESRFKLRSCLERKLMDLSTRHGSVSAQWEAFKTVIISACAETIGYTSKKHQDWFDDNDSQIKELIDRKHAAFVDWQNNPQSLAKKELYHQLWAKTQHKIHTMAIKAIYGPTSNGAVPLQSSDGTILIKDNKGILQYWKEHFHKLLNRDVGFDSPTIDKIPQHPLITELHLLLESVWAQEEVPQDLKDAIITIFKKKGDKSGYGNYRGIALLSIAAKILSRVLLNRLLPRVEEWEAFQSEAPSSEDKSLCYHHHRATKTQVLFQPAPNSVASSPSITINGTTFENVEHFLYLGSYLSKTVFIDEEIQYRIKCASTAFGRLRHCVFNEKGLT
uniref:Reverse transcriptase domain-containing protein n=1 Tax=Latimeria chalumnae TaxID=7897 RepID=H3AEA9_LATCH